MVETIARDVEGVREKPQPRLTFACELSSERLDDLFADRSIIAGLRALNSRVALALADFTPERARVVHRLNDEGVPVIAIPLLSFDEGYYFTADNLSNAWNLWIGRGGVYLPGVRIEVSSTERFPPWLWLADLQYVDGLGKQPGAPGAAAELAENSPRLELGIRALAGCAEPRVGAVGLFL
jgi:hypothetical protein